MRREETGVPGENPRSHDEVLFFFFWTETQSIYNIVVEVEGVIDVHCASLTSQGVQHRVFYMVSHPDINPIQQGLTSVNRWEPVFSLW